jgi:hypothetical protein
MGLEAENWKIAWSSCDTLINLANEFPQRLGQIAHRYSFFVVTGDPISSSPDDIETS